MLLKLRQWVSLYLKRDTSGMSTIKPWSNRHSFVMLLIKEIERLKIATGDAMNPSESFNLGMHQMPFPGSNFFSIPSHSSPSGHHQNMQFPPFGHSPSSMPTHQLQQTNAQQISDMLQNDQLGRLQGLD